jgi:hypothetical protein
MGARNTLQLRSGRFGSWRSSAVGKANRRDGDTGHGTFTEMRRRFRNDYFQGRFHVQFDEVAAKGGATTLGNDHVRMDLRRAIGQGSDITEKRNHLNLFVDLNPLVRLYLKVKPANDNTGRCPDAPKFCTGHPRLMRKAIQLGDSLVAIRKD